MVRMVNQAVMVDLDLMVTEVLTEGLDDLVFPDLLYASFDFCLRSIEWNIKSVLGVRVS